MALSAHHDWMRGEVWREGSHHSLSFSNVNALPTLDLSLSPLAVGARLSRSRRSPSSPIGRQLDQSEDRNPCWRTPRTYTLVSFKWVCPCPCLCPCLCHCLCLCLCHCVVIVRHWRLDQSERTWFLVGISLFEMSFLVFVKCQATTAQPIWQSSWLAWRKTDITDQLNLGEHVLTLYGSAMYYRGTNKAIPGARFLYLDICSNAQM